MHERVTYKFDVAAVVTIDITTAAGIDAARKAVDHIQQIEGLDIETDAPADAAWDMTCVAPRGRGWLVSIDPDNENLGDEDVTDGGIPEPLLDAREALREALGEADDALGGDSNDAEHDALYSIRETIAGLLGVDTDPPSPADTI